MGNYGIPSPDGSREFCAHDAEILGKFGVPPMLFPDGIGARCGKIQGSLDALPKRNRCECRKIWGSPRCSFWMELVKGVGKFGVPLTLFPNGIGASVGKFKVPPTLFPNGIGASVGKFGVPLMLFSIRIGASVGKFRVPLTPFPNGIGASVGKFVFPSTPFPNIIGASLGKFEPPSTPFPNGIGASVGKFRVPMSVQTEYVPSLQDPPVYMSKRNSFQA